MTDRVRVVDCTLREGDQTAGVSMPPGRKLEIALSLDDAGVAMADAGMPAVNVDEQRFLREAVAQCQRMVVGASVRCRPDMVRLAMDCGVGAVFIICPISDGHLSKRLGIERGRLLDTLGECVALIGGRASIEVVAEDASRASKKNLSALVDAATALGVDRVYLADTVGSQSPEAWRALVQWMMHRLRGGPELGVHCHNDFGMATALTVAAIEAGVRWPTVTVNGLGERAGNADLGSVVVSTEALLDLKTGVRLSSLPALSKLVERAACVPVPAAHPIVGANAFRHESGIHVHGVLADPGMYEAIEPNRVGRERTLLLGKHSGTAHLAAVLDAEEVVLTPAELDALRSRVQAEAMKQDSAAFDALLDAEARHRQAAQGVAVSQVLLWAHEMVVGRE